MLGVYLSKWQFIPRAVLPLPTKQFFWDSPVITQARQQVEESKSDATQKAIRRIYTTKIENKQKHNIIIIITRTEKKWLK